MKSLRSTSGEVTLILLGVLGLAALLGWSKPWKLLSKQPPTAQLDQANRDLAIAKARAADAEAQLAAAQAQERKKQEDQVRYSQTMLVGAGSVIHRAPQSPEVQVAGSLVDRATVGLTAAIGELPDDQRTAILAAVDAALAAKDHEIETLNLQVKNLDAGLKETSSERDQLKAEVPLLTESKKAADARAGVAEKLRDSLSEEVKTYAASKAAEEQKSMGLAGLLNGARTTVIVLLAIIILGAVAYYGIHFALPSLAQEFPQAARFQTFYRGVVSAASAHLIDSSKSP
jgi:hypothetical protein